MKRTAKAWIVALLLMIGVVWVSIGDSEPAIPSLITGVDELIGYPQPVPPSESPELYVVVVPGTERAVLLRPITAEEFGSYQVQAIAAEMIAHQLLAAAFVVPVVREQDVVAFPVELARFLKEIVNRISRFTVFEDVLAPSLP